MWMDYAWARLWKKIGLYADDTILYLADQGPSLQAALGIIEKMESFSGLRINWDKSQILPLDQFSPTFHISRLTTS